MKIRIFLLLAMVVASFAVERNSDIGVSLAGLDTSPADRVKLANELGASWYRPEPILLSSQTPTCDDCGPATASGLKLLLVIRNASAADKPGQGVRDTADFQQRVQTVIERYKPGLLVVETEPDDAKSFAGTPDEFAAELKIACEAAHAAKTQCANGGISSRGIALVVTDQRWQADQYDAARFANSTEIVRARGRQGFAIVGKDVTKGKSDDQAVFTATGKYLGENHRANQRIRDLISATNSSGADYFNFHWYELVPENIPKVADTLHQLTKLPLMTDELGQRNERPFETGEKIKQALDSFIRPVIWSAVDGSGGSIGLVDKKGKQRSNALAFQRAAKQNNPQ